MTWQTHTLALLGAPTRTTSIEVLTEWALSEGTLAAIDNPLACGTPFGGSTRYNATGVQHYPSLTVAAEAYAFSLTHYPYRNIGAAFVAGASPLHLWRLINASPWCSHCQTGHYPEVLWATVGRPTPSTPTTPATPSPSSSSPSSGSSAPLADLTTKWSRVQDDAGPHAAALRVRIIGLRTVIKRA